MHVSFNRRERQHLEAKAAAHAELLHSMDNSFDLVTQLEIKDGVARRAWSSASHLAVLGHEPDSCIGDMRALPHLKTKEFVEEQLPNLISTFEARTMPDGFRFEEPLLHADGHVVWFEHRVKLNYDEGTRCMLTSRDITDRCECERRVREEQAQMAVRRVQEQHALALSRIADVVMELQVGDWADPLDSCDVVEANEAYLALFGQETSAGPWPALCHGQGAVAGGPRAC